jgi:hypothetical protein
MLTSQDILLRMPNSKGFRDAHTLRLATSPRAKDSYQREPSIKMQRATVKTFYTSPDKLGAHLKYVERDGAGKNEEKAKLFTSEGRNVEDAAKEPDKKEERFWKIILSPENGADIEKIKKYGMEQYTKDFVDQIEKDTGQKYRWAAAVHYDTDNIHSHIIIRGTDYDGKDVKFTQNMIQQRMRGIASAIATRELGQRTTIEIEKQKNREITQARFNNLDRQIKTRIDVQKNGDLLVSSADRYQHSRLKYLAEIGLAKKDQRGFILKPTWERDLKDFSKKEDVLKTVYGNRVPEKKQENILIYRKKWAVEGIVEKKGMADERYDKPYVLVRNKSGKLYYQSNDDLHNVREGDRVSIKNGVTTILSKEQSKTTEKTTTRSKTTQGRTTSEQNNNTRQQNQEYKTGPSMQNRPEAGRSEDPLDNDPIIIKMRRDADRIFKKKEEREAREQQAAAKKAEQEAAKNTEQKTTEKENESGFKSTENKGEDYLPEVKKAIEKREAIREQQENQGKDRFTEDHPDDEDKDWDRGWD